MDLGVVIGIPVAGFVRMCGVGGARGRNRCHCKLGGMGLGGEGKSDDECAEGVLLGIVRCREGEGDIDVVRSC